MTMSKMKKTLTAIFLGAAVVGFPVAGAFTGGYLHDKYAGPVPIPQTTADLPQETCGPDFCLKIPQDRLEDRLAAIKADPEGYQKKVEAQNKGTAVLAGFAVPVMILMLGGMVYEGRRNHEPKP